jgi:putative membrane protein
MNFSEFNKTVRLLTLVCICIGLYSAITSGTILLFLHPRSLPLVKIAWIIIVALTLSDLKTFAKATGKTKLDWRYFALLLPIALVLSVKPTGLSSRIAVQKGVSSLASAIKSGQPVDIRLNMNDSILPAMDQAALSQGASSYPVVDSRIVSAQAVESRTSISDTIKEDSMYVKLDRIYSNPNAQKGQRITMTGFIAPDTVLGRNSFFLTRMMVACCAADAMPVGFYCMTDSVLGIRENDWVVLTGVIEARMVKLPWNKEKQTLPVLRGATVKKTVAPQNQYVYPVAY